MEEPSRYSPWGCKESDRTERLQFHFRKHYYKARRGDGILAELFQILKDDAVKVLHSLCQQIWKTQQWPQDWKRSVFIPIPKKGNAKECSNYHTTALISHANKIMRKILQAGFSCTWTENFQMYELNLEKAEKGATEDEMVGWHHWLNGH